MKHCCPALLTASTTGSSKRQGGLWLQQLDQKTGTAATSWGGELYAGPAWFGEQMALRWKAGILQELVAEGLAAQC